ncbi:hypothetical protein GGR54DRAFT_627041 [Hypoxylon sp. NC1633]|nr:hypothetical protein GGR54DRAFT_627041 [Hypoxylon sp. NC1633]
MMASSAVNSEKKTSLAALAQRISSLTSEISSYLAANSLPEPNFTPDGESVPETPEYEAIRASLNDATQDLLSLVNGPKNTLQSFLFSYYDIATMQVALDRRMFDHIPLPPASSSGNGVSEASVSKASVAETAQKAGMDEDRAGRFLKVLATRRIFEEVEGEPDTFTHTANSALLARDPVFSVWANMHLDEYDQSRVRNFFDDLFLSICFRQYKNRFSSTI